MAQRSFFSMEARGNAAFIYGGGQIPEANPLMGGLIEKVIHMGMFKCVYGISRSYEGMADKSCYERMTKAKSIKIQKQIGTYFGTCRNFDPADEKNFPAILEQLKEHEITDLIVCGGDGSARAAVDFEKKLKEVNYSLRIIWIPCTIDGINGTESIGFFSAVNQSLERIFYVAANAWATFDYGKKGPRVAVIELMGRNRDDILTGVIVNLEDVGEIGRFELSEICVIAIPSAHEWSVENLLATVSNSEKPILIIASEGAKPKDGWPEESGVGSVAKKIATLIELEKERRVNTDVIGYLSQSNPFGEEALEDEEFKAWIKAAIINIIARTHSDEAQAIIKEGCQYSNVPLTKITAMNPNSKEIVPLSDDDKEVLEPYLV